MSHPLPHTTLTQRHGKITTNAHRSCVSLGGETTLVGKLGNREIIWCGYSLSGETAECQMKLRIFQWVVLSKFSHIIFPIEDR